jgi:hypothetical protein
MLPYKNFYNPFILKKNLPWRKSKEWIIVLYLEKQRNIYLEEEYLLVDARNFIILINLFQRRKEWASLRNP